MAFASDAYESTLLTEWEKVLPRLDLQQNSVDFLTSCQEVINIITNYLWFRKSDLLRKRLTATLEVGSNTVYLPEEFIAIETEPVAAIKYEPTKYKKLANLPENKRATRIEDSNETAELEYFELVDTAVTFFPYPDVEADITIDIYAKPEKLTSFDSTLPWNGIFNDIIIDNAVKISNFGMSILQDQTFVTSITLMLERIVNMRTKKTVYFRMV